MSESESGYEMQVVGSGWGSQCFEGRGYRVRGRWSLTPELFLSELEWNCDLLSL